MGRYKGPSCKICRRNGEKLYLKGERCHTAKCEIDKRNFPPGDSVRRFARKASEYGRRLREKQKLRFFYGVSEKQMRIYFSKASKQKGVTGHNLLTMFESRIDNVLFRSNLARSRAEARQLVKHGHFKVNKRKMDIPSFLSSEGDEVIIDTADNKLWEERIKALEEKGYPAWMSFDKANKSLTILHLPKREEIDVPVEEQLIVEFYSK